MATVDLTSIVSLTGQIANLQGQLTAATDPTLKLLLQSQIASLTAQLSSEAQHAQAQSDASSNLLNTLGLFTTLTNTVGTLAPSIISLLKP